MARIRNIKPDSFIDYDLNHLPPLHRWLFPALWCHADRDGVLEDKPMELKVRCLPWDECDMDAMLWDLHRAGFIIRYEADGRQLISIPGFTEHQKFHRDEKPRGLPQPTPETVRAPCQHPAGTLPARDVTPAVGTDTKPTPRASTPDVGCRMSEDGISPRPAVAVGSANPVSAMGGTNAPAVARAAIGVIDGGETLEEGIKRIWLKKRGSAWVWRSAHESELRPAFDMAGGDLREVLRVFEAALDRTYPRLTKLKHLAEHYADYAATKEPAGKSNANARATQADRWDADYQPPLDEDGNVDLLQGKAQ